MKTKYLIGLFILIAGFLMISSALAAEIQYPVKELGNCSDEAACKTYCDKPKNMQACLDFAEKNNLMSSEEIATAKKFMATGSEGPGGCTNKDTCETYCNNMTHIDECVAFAEKNNLMSPQELTEAKQVQAALKRGVKPPPCGNKKACDTYCEDPNHMEECINFGIEAGFIQGKELEDAQKMLAAVKRGVKPPPCKGKKACDEYCQTSNHMEECINFAIEAGFMSEQEKTDSQKMLQALKKGVKPPNCRGKEECDIYCQQDEHFEECMNFAEAAGFMSADDAAMARKTGGKGPGGCKGKEECEAFCNNPDNQETCFNFGKENGLIPEADLKQMEQGKKQLQESLNQAPPAVLDCLSSQLGINLMEKLKNGTAMPSRDIGDKMKTCFESNMGPGGPSGSGGPGNGPNTPAQIGPQGGPGGCQTQEECKNYCDNNPEECKNFRGPQNEPGDFQPGPGQINPGGQMMPPQAGPGGCKTPEECKAFCEANPEQCKPTTPPENQIPPEGECCRCCPPEVENCIQACCPCSKDRMMPPESMTQPENMMRPPERMMPPENNPPQPQETSSNLFQIIWNFLSGK